MLYDIPHRAGTAIATETLLRLAEHPRVVAVKDAKSDLVASAGGDGGHRPRLLLRRRRAHPAAAVGRRRSASIGTSTHFCGPQARALVEAALAGDPAEALRLHRRLLPIFTGIFATQGAILVKAGLELQGRGRRAAYGCRWCPATAEQRAALARALDAAGLPSGPGRPRSDRPTSTRAGNAGRGLPRSTGRTRSSSRRGGRCTGC